MQPKYAIRVENPCKEAWENFSSTPGGRWCPSCRHQVVDFTLLSDEEVTRYLDTHTGKICARLLPDQIKVYPQYPKNTTIKSPGLPVMMAGMLGVLVTMSSTAEAQEKPVSSVDVVDQSGKTRTPGRQATITGIVTSQVDGMPLPGANVVVKGTIAGTISDKSGRFSLKKTINRGDVIVFSFIGYQSVEYVVQDSLDIDLAIEMVEGKLSECVIYVTGALSVDELYTRDNHKETFWSRVKNLFASSKRDSNTGRNTSDFLE